MKANVKIKLAGKVILDVDNAPMSDGRIKIDKEVEDSVLRAAINDDRTAPDLSVEIS